jgi:hypothetical protein
MKNMLLFIPAALLVLSCTSTRVTTDYDKSVNFNRFSSFSFYGWSDDTEKMLNRFDRERIENALIDEFRVRGISHVQNGGDLLVSLYLIAEEEEDKTAHTGYYGYPYLYYG